MARFKGVGPEANLKINFDFVDDGSVPGECPGFFFCMHFTLMIVGHAAEIDHSRVDAHLNSAQIELI